MTEFPWLRKATSQHLTKPRALSRQQAYHCEGLQSRDAFVNGNSEERKVQMSGYTQEQEGRITLCQKTFKKAELKYGLKTYQKW